jgi:bifunctional UDP-N-acetylglucosamine pyrophosphorylase/glucosamine-1-phosphate N-acetyltransferase
MKRKTIVLVLGRSGGAGFASSSDKLAHPLLGKSLVSYILEAVAGLGSESVVLAVDDVDPERLGGAISGARISSVSTISLTARRAWTGKAAAGLVSFLLAAAPALRKGRAADILIAPADTPLLKTKTLRGLLSAHRKKHCSLTVMSFGPDLDRDSVAVVRGGDLVPLLPALARAGRRAGLQTVAALLSARGKKVGLTELSDEEETLRVEGRAGLAGAARILRQRKNESLARSGVTLFDPLTTWIDWEVEIGAGTVIYPSAVIEGPTRIGRDCRVYPHVHIMASRLGDRVKVLSSTVIEDCRLEDDVQVGPFSRLRPKTVVRAFSRVGNFVEMKNTVFGPRSKAQHLSYLGDSLVEEDVNIGAGTITCNYDGVRKNRTLIGAGAFIGSGTELIAPLKVGKKAYVAAGSTITKDVGPASLAISRTRQVEKPGWVLERMKRLQKKGRALK